MNNTYQIYLISTQLEKHLDRIFLALKAQFKNFKYKIINILLQELKIKYQK